MSSARSLSSVQHSADAVARNWWLSQLNNDKFVLNPILCAFEGSWRREPTFEEFCTELGRASTDLAESFPACRIVTHDAAHFAALYSLRQELWTRHGAESAFLIEVSPLITQRPGPRLARAIEARIFSAADQLGVPRRSLVVLAALACLYEGQSGQGLLIGRGLLKPTADFDEEDAYNVLADLRGLEFLIRSSAHWGASQALLTHDRCLAAFWCEIRLSELVVVNAIASFKVAPSPSLLPGLKGELDL